MLTRALAFLGRCGSLVLTLQDTTVVLSPLWLAQALSCVITIDPSRVNGLPTDLVRRGYLQHDQAVLAMVWRDSEGYCDAVRAMLLQALHRFEFAFELLHGDGSSREVSLVPSMLPKRPDWYLDDARLAEVFPPVSTSAGEVEAGVVYRLAFVAADLWPLLVARCARLAVPEHCSDSSAMLQYASQRALLTLDPIHAEMRVVCRGVDPTVLRSRVHDVLVRLLEDKFVGLAETLQVCS